MTTILFVNIIAIIINYSYSGIWPCSFIKQNKNENSSDSQKIQNVCMQINKSYNTGKTGQNWKGKIQSWTSEIKSQDLKLYS